MSPTHQDLSNDTTFSQIKSRVPVPLSTYQALATHVDRLEGIVLHSMYGTVHAKTPAKAMLSQIFGLFG